MADVALALFGGALVAWAAGEAALTSIDRPTRGTLALATGALLLASHVGGVIEHVVGGARAGSGAIAIGGALFVVGIGLRLCAIAALGSAFASALDSPRLVTTGVYRWLRHPSEVGLVVAMAAGGVLLASRFALLATVAALPIAIARCRREDAALAAGHPRAHLAWASRVGWFGPRA